MHVGTDVVVLKKNLDSLPRIINKMYSVDIPIDEAVLKELDPDVYIYRNYLSDEGRTINVYIGYYGTRKGGRSSHNPDACYPGSGWAIISENKATVPVENGTRRKGIVVNTFRVAKGGEQQLVYHWYQTDRSTVTATGIQQNLNRFKNRLLHNRDDGAFIRVSTVMLNNYLQAKKDIESFIGQLYPILVQYWPQERDIEE